MRSVAIMTYSWSTLSYWPDRQYWLIEETPMLSWQLEVMVGGNRAGDGEGCSLSFELYCCYRFPIRKKDGPLYWPTTSINVCLNHTDQQKPFCPTSIHNQCNTVQCLSFWRYYFMRYYPLHGCVSVYPDSCISVSSPRLVCEMAAAPKGSAPGPVKLCVDECRPELRAQSSQLYSFLVILKHCDFVNLFCNRQCIYNDLRLNECKPTWSINNTGERNRKKCFCLCYTKAGY